MAENKPIVESIKIGTLEKQIEILEQLGLTRSEITNLIYDTQGKITAENTDTLDIILEQFAKLLEQDELKTIEELARTLLANQSDASVRYVLQHELVGKVFKYILNSNDDRFENKTTIEIFMDRQLSLVVLSNTKIRSVCLKSKYMLDLATDYTESSKSLIRNRNDAYQIFNNPEYGLIRNYCLTKNTFLDVLYDYCHYTEKSSFWDLAFCDSDKNVLTSAPLAVLNWEWRGTRVAEAKIGNFLDDPATTKKIEYKGRSTIIDFYGSYFNSQNYNKVNVVEYKGGESAEKFKFIFFINAPDENVGLHYFHWGANGGQVGDKVPKYR